MDVLKNIKDAIDLLEQNEEYYDGLFEMQSKVDKKIDYWLHYIEFNNVKVTETYKIIKEIKKLRKERRNLKNDIELIKVFKENEGKMQNTSNRKILLTQICKVDSKQRNAKYNYEAYTKEEANEILGIINETKENLKEA